MKTGNSRKNTVLTGGMTLSDMGVSRDDLENTLTQIEELFVNGIYANKILAPVRELISNALDEHSQHNVDQHVDVYISKDNDGRYKWGVRDYALGLDEEGVRTVLVKLLKSTKNKDNKAMGGFGVGAKSFFAYADSAVIVSYHGGLKSTYAAFIGERGRGELGLVFQEPSTETGIEISFNINHGDIYQFDKYTRQYIFNCLPTSKIRYTDRYNHVHRGEKHKFKKIKFKDFTYTYCEDYMDQTFFGSTYAETLSIRMGNVCYPYPKQKLKGFSAGDYQNGYIDVPIGYLSLPIHREAINDNPENNAKIKTIFRTLMKDRQRVIDNHPKNVLDLTKNFWAVGPYKGKMKAVVGANFHPELSNEKENKKTELIVVPNNRAAKTWIKRFQKEYKPKETGCNYIYMSTDLTEAKDIIKLLRSHKVTIDFNLRFAKKLKLPALTQTKKGERIYTFWLPRSHTTVKMTIEDFHKKFFPEAKLDQVNHTSDLEKFCVSTRGGYYYYRTHYKCCESAVKALLKKGWHSPESKEIKSKKAEISDLAIRNRDERNLNYRIDDYAFISARTKRVLKNKKFEERQKKFEQIQRIISASLRKGDLKGKMIQIVVDCYGVSDIINEKELKQILRKL